MYCKHCGGLIDDDSVFCMHCGKLVKLKEESDERNSTNSIVSVTGPGPSNYQLIAPHETHATLGSILSGILFFLIAFE